MPYTLPDGMSETTYVRRVFQGGDHSKKVFFYLNLSG